ncbi:MAG: DNA-deoxyinosine glycosylase [Novosphingobium sp.]
MRDETRHTCFAPQVAPDCRVLILGSLPGAVSLAQAQYYAHPRNQFWQVLGAMLGIDLVNAAYEARIASLNARGIGLWDCIASAQRRGSLDGAIRTAQINPLQEFVNGLPQLRAVAFNGVTAAKIGHVQLSGNARIEKLALPSTSPAYTMPLNQKLAAWEALVPFVTGP